MSNRFSYNQYTLSPNSNHSKNSARRGALDFIANSEVKKSTPSSTTFDFNSWIQHGSLCKSSCVSQLRDEELKLQQRTTSFSSTNTSCYTTEDNSSLNDSFDDVYDIKDDVNFDHSNWLHGGHQVDGKLHQYNHPDLLSSSEKHPAQSLDLSRLKYSALEEYNKASFSSQLQSIHRSPKRTSYYTYKPKQRYSSNQTTTAMLRRRQKQREWKTAVDPKSGRRYYYDVHTRETQWHKPVELASRSERKAIEDKERKQRDFFQAMEKNILKSMQVGQVPGSQSFDQEDTVESLPSKPKKVLSKRNRPKPQLVRTISSMDHELLKELTNIEVESRSPQTPTTANASSDLASTSFFDSLPQPESQIHNLHSLSSVSTASSHEKDFPSNKLPSKPGEILSFDKSDIRTTLSSKFSVSSSDSQSNASKTLPRPNLAKRNTCGTMYVSTTMAAPDKDAAIKCVCGVYRTHIIHSLNDCSHRTKFDEYEIFNDIKDSSSRNTKGMKLPPGQKAAIVEADFGIELTIKSSDSQDNIPSLEEISAFFRYIFNKAQLENDTIIMSLIYVERLLRETNGGVRPNLQNWKSLLFSCMIMASKVWDDLSMWNVDFSQASPEGIIFSLKRINELELAVLSCLNYNVKVPASEYAKYYFLMRSMLIRSGLAGEEFRSSKPLDMERAQKFEMLTASYNAKPKVAPGSLRRSKSTGNNGESKSSGTPSIVALEQLVNM